MSALKMKTFTAEQAVECYRKVARKWLDMVFEPSTCIEQSRVLIEVLKRFGIQAEAIGTKMVLTCTEKEFQFVSGIDREETERAKNICKSFQQRWEKNPLPDDRVVRHVIVLVERQIWVDPTLYQASAPKFNFILDPDIMMLPLPNPLPDDYVADLEAEYTTDDGTKFTVRWIAVPDRGWEEDDGWEPSHLWPLIDRIEREMRIAA